MRRFDADLPSLEPTPRDVFLDRRRFMQFGVAAAGMTVAAPLARAQDAAPAPPVDAPDPRIVPPYAWPDEMKAIASTDYRLPASIEGVSAAPTDRLQAASHCNFYEFLPGRGGDVHPRTSAFEVDPWTIEVAGACAKPGKIGLEDILRIDHEERLYHFRCVERWAMNVPWVGFALRSLLLRFEPTSEAKYVRFVTAKRPEQMPGLASAPGYPWPYFEALTMREAMNELALAVTGCYGEPLPKQHGAPLRVIVPWKYGYKSPKSIVRIEFLRTRPDTFWMRQQPHEYGFISNVNPNIPHPRWPQTESYWIGETDAKFPTPIFNGYGVFVADMYPDEPTEPVEPKERGETAR